MIKKLKLTLLLLLLPVAAWAAEFEAGKHYVELDTAKSASPQVMEFFSFYCPHCYKMEPVAIALAKQLPAGTAFNKKHVDFLGGLNKEQQTILTRGYLVAKEKGVEESMTKAIFNYIHRDKARFSSIKDVRDLFVLNGIDGKAFDDLAFSMPVEAQINDMVAEQTKYTQLGALSGVPTFIVNDKYKVNFHEVKSQEEFNQLVSFLLAK
ncbi:thiol:disulfide interchange protein DsbA/DsbL [Pseudoalteromonas tunicata]|nr:thiol:disulfide interchange protein DsbA/DsbL [Pseudoalteromonas tunicata]ATC96061.1 thiol:disulfide interchange protein DsbA [Pseudoalteromonas tunicata]AXT31590.1 thiol:disulfide interchange protein DsbA/DsbL [Pseudoalteromonas tunicata]MDP4982638.1 thiol:disulfide interchange protein DsbA/DsbL [Pseudoalteromonas tunicata]MDP5213279.1 thiol:disulfide interchange protein DsbA/DsbL [Pseudoalteromonas tunicata]